MVRFITPYIYSYCVLRIADRGSRTMVRFITPYIYSYSVWRIAYVEICITDCIEPEEQELQHLSRPLAGTKLKY